MDFDDLDEVEAAAGPSPEERRLELLEAAKPEELVFPVAEGRKFGKEGRLKMLFLHGGGTNGKIAQMQIANTFGQVPDGKELLEWTVWTGPHKVPLGWNGDWSLEPFGPDYSVYFERWPYANSQREAWEGIDRTLEEFRKHLQDTGPYDGLCGFDMGGELLVHVARKAQEGDPGFAGKFRFLILLTTGSSRHLSPLGKERPRRPLQVPTLLSWSSSDQNHPYTVYEETVLFFHRDFREVVLHKDGHMPPRLQKESSELARLSRFLQGMRKPGAGSGRPGSWAPSDHEDNAWCRDLWLPLLRCAPSTAGAAAHPPPRRLLLVPDPLGAHDFEERIEEADRGPEPLRVGELFQASGSPPPRSRVLRTKLAVCTLGPEAFRQAAGSSLSVESVEYSAEQRGHNWHCKVTEVPSPQLTPEDIIDDEHQDAVARYWADALMQRFSLDEGEEVGVLGLGTGAFLALAIARLLVHERKRTPCGLWLANPPSRLPWASTARPGLLLECPVRVLVHEDATYGPWWRYEVSTCGPFSMATFRSARQLVAMVVQDLGGRCEVPVEEEEEDGQQKQQEVEQAPLAPGPDVASPPEPPAEPAPAAEPPPPAPPLQAAAEPPAEAAAAEEAAAAPPTEAAGGAPGGGAAAAAHVRPKRSYPVAIFDRLQMVTRDRLPELEPLGHSVVQLVITDGEAGGGKEARICVELPEGRVSRGGREAADVEIGMCDADYLALWKNALSVPVALTTQRMWLGGRRVEELAPLLLPVLFIDQRTDGDPPEWDGLKPPPPRGKFVQESTGRAEVKPWKPKLAALPSKLRQITPYKEKLQAKPRKEFYDEMDKIKDKGPVGHFYGLEFPYTLEMIHRYGKEWLTKALHAAGTLAKTNKVVAMEVEPFVGGSMSMKCFLHCTYAREEEGLHAQLFCKYPFPCESEADRKTRYISRFLLNNDGPELDFARILSAGAPMRCPKYYYGDICLKTGTVLLITEKLDLPSHTSDFGPNELEPIPYKSVDYLLDAPLLYYEAMTRNVAKLAAWGWSGKMGKDILNVFTPPEHPTAYFMGTKKRCEETIFFVRDNAPQLFPPGVCDAGFEQSLREVMCEVEQAQREILDFLFADSRYCGFTHENMNTDNAFFWRDASGQMQSGFIDWGRFKRNNLARGLTTGYMCTDLCDFMQEHDQYLLKAFVDEYSREGGPNIRFEIFWEHYLLSWCLLGLLMVDLPHQIWISSPYTTQEGWATIKDYKDPRIFRMPNYTNGNIAMLRNFVWYWHYRDLPAFWKSWRRAHPPAAKAKAAPAKRQ